MNSLHIEPLLSKSTDDWLQSFLSPAKERPVFQVDSSSYKFTRIAIRVLGVPLDEDEYYNSLFDMKQKPFLNVLSEELDKTIDNTTFRAVQEIIDINQKQANGLSTNRLIAFMYGKNLIPKLNDPTLNRHLQLSVIKVIEIFRQKHQSLQTEKFRRFIIDQVKWMKNHLGKWTVNMQIGEDFPKVIWYGNLTENQQYFLLLLMEFGCDVIIFHPEGKDEFAAIDPDHDYSIVYKYAHNGVLEDFPSQIRERQTTVAFRANKQLEIMMADHNAGIFKPWQLRKHLPSSVTMKMTYDDIFIYAKEKAMIRPQFKVTNEHVIIPVIFAKIQGVSRNRNEYWERIRELKEHSYALSIKQFPFSQTTKANYHYHFQHSLDKGTLSPEKMINSSWWQYGHLPNELQLAIACTIKNYSEQPKLMKTKQESDYDLQLFLFKQAALLPDTVLQLMQKYDYSQEIPRLVLYNMETNGELSREDASLLLFLNEFGFDIILYNPAGHNDIEKYIDPIHYDVHWLEEVVFEQEYQEPKQKDKSVFSKLFKRYFDR